MKKSNRILLYDSSFNGFLSAVYVAFKANLEIEDIRSSKNIQGALFSETVKVETNELQARRVWYAIQRKNYSAIKDIYFAFLSESHGIEFLLLKYIKRIFSTRRISDSYDFKEDELKIKSLAGLVAREKKRLESEVNVQDQYSDLKLAYIEPAFNVLPLLSRYFKSVHKDFRWIIFDLKRKYGIYYSDQRVQLVSAAFVSNLIAQKQLIEPQLQFAGQEINTDKKGFARKPVLYEKTFSAA